MVGTHTHVRPPTNALPRGTGYVTDIGMTGPIDSIIGMKREIILERFLTQRPHPFKVATQNLQLQGVVLTIDSRGRCGKVQRLQMALKPA